MALNHIRQTLPFDWRKPATVKIEDQVECEPALLFDEPVQFQKRHIETFRERRAQSGFAAPRSPINAIRR
ncbi:MAG TPA: hypothetical protein VGL82_14155 [Bryobacteraceae bacterium]|jgi:hypothetical protein